MHLVLLKVVNYPGNIGSLLHICIGELSCEVKLALHPARNSIDVEVDFVAVICDVHLTQKIGEYLVKHGNTRLVNIKTSLFQFFYCLHSFDLWFDVIF